MKRHLAGALALCCTALSAQAATDDFAILQPLAETPRK